MNSEELVAHLANYMLNAREGDRLPTVRQIARLNHTSVGAVSNALAALENTGAVQIERRGHLGSFVGARSIGRLWAIAEREPMVISFPLIAHSRLEGLATALKKQLLDAGVDVYLIFIRGSRTRIKALRENKCHIAVMSSFAANELCGKSEQLLLTLPAESYVSRHEVFYRPDQPEPGHPLRVAIDHDSFDIEGLSELEFADHEVEFKPVTFMQLPRLLKNNTVDAGIWSIDDMRPHLGEHILHRPLSEKAAALLGERNTSAALVARAGSSSTRAVIESALDPVLTVRIQQMVIDGEMVPEY